MDINTGSTFAARLPDNKGQGFGGCFRHEEEQSQIQSAPDGIAERPDMER